MIASRKPHSATARATNTAQTTTQAPRGSISVAAVGADIGASIRCADIMARSMSAPATPDDFLPLRRRRSCGARVLR